MHSNRESLSFSGRIGALQRLEWTGFYQYIRWLPKNFVEAEAENMTLGFFHRWPFYTGQAT